MGSVLTPDTAGCPGAARSALDSQTLQSKLMAALDTVRDPELDEPVTSLGFVASLEVDDGSVEVHLRLPTYFCAPNFAFLMVADAFDAVAAVPGVNHTMIVLDDHFASDTINTGVAARADFQHSFGDEAAGNLDTLRADFIRKAVMAGTDRVCRPLLTTGVTPTDLAEMSLGQLPASADLDRLRERRAEIGLPADDDAPILIDVTTGKPIDTASNSPEALRLHLGKARLSRVNIEANGSICRGMLATRYAGRGHGQVEDIDGIGAAREVAQ